MPAKCCVVNRSMRADRDGGKVKFFRFPLIQNRSEELNRLSKERQRAWIKAINRKDLKEISYKYTNICSLHFVTGTSANIKDNFHPDWVPSINMGYITTPKINTGMQRYQRKLKKDLPLMNTKKDSTTPVMTTVADPNLLNESLQKGCQTEGFYIEEAAKEEFQKKYKKLLEENMELKNKLKKLNENASHKITKEELSQKAAKVKYFTGFPNFETMDIIYTEVEPYLQFSVNGKITKFDAFFIAFMKLRLDLPFKFMSYQYKVSVKTLSKTFHDTLIVLYKKLSCFVFWPDKEAIIQNTPSIFKNMFGEKRIIIIDCFEVFCERRGNILARANTFSAYKHHQTLKYLIGISPFCSIVYISKAFGGRCSDKFVLENCGFMDMISSNDIILADRGFLVGAAVLRKGAKFITPAFKNRRTQLEPMSIEKSRAISSVRIHVERIIGILRQRFLILTNRLPVSTMSKSIEKEMYFDYILKITCALVNLSPAILQFSSH